MERAKQCPVRIMYRFLFWMEAVTWLHEQIAWAGGVGKSKHQQEGSFSYFSKGVSINSHVYLHLANSLRASHRRYVENRIQVSALIQHYNTPYFYQMRAIIIRDVPCC
eukprot:scaffold19142_cov146-Skeletonema_menzelii.AAC.2